MRRMRSRLDVASYLRRFSRALRKPSMRALDCLSVPLVVRGAEGHPMTDQFTPALEEMIEEAALNWPGATRCPHQPTRLAYSSSCHVCRTNFLRNVVRAVLRDGDEALMLAEGPSTLKELAAGFVERAVRIVELEAALGTVEASNEKVLDRLRANWPHIQVPIGPSRFLHGARQVKDPGAPTCLRCKIEEAIRG